jgi:MFS family permease
MTPQSMQVFAGPLVDRWSIRRILVGTQLAQATLVLTIPLADYLGLLSVWVVLTVMPLVSLLNQLVYPAQSAVVPRLVDDDDLVAANSLLSLSYQGVDMAFNAVAGVLIAATSAVALYLVDSVSFAIAAGLFVRLSIPAATGESGGAQERHEVTATGDAVADGGTDDAGADGASSNERSSQHDDVSQQGYFADLRAGLGFVRSSLLFPMLASGLVVNGLLGGVWATMPAFADAQGGPEAYGLLMAAVAGGILVGALVASKFDHLPFGTLTIWMFVFSGCAWLVAIAVPSLAGTVALLALATLPIGISNVLTVAMIQSLVPESLLGRVMATVGSASTLMMPIGSALGGLVGDYAGATVVVTAGGVGFLFVAVYVLTMPALRELPAIGDIETLSA